MPKKSSALCIFCGNEKCTCGLPAPRVTTPKVAKAARTRPPVLPSPTPQPGGSSAFESEPIEPKARFALKKPVEPERDLSGENALRVLLMSGILKPSSAREVEKILYPPKSQAVDRKISEWKARNGLVD